MLTSRYKIIFSVLLTAMIFVACHQNSEDSAPEGALSTDLINNPNTASGRTYLGHAPIITYDTDHHDFGKVTEGEKVTYSFHFKNTGNTDLLIRHAQASCGCTVPEWPKDPLAPGKEGFITVTFNSEGKSGQFNKSVTIISNTIPNTTNIYITGEVVK